MICIDCVLIGENSSRPNVWYTRVGHLRCNCNKRINWRSQTPYIYPTWKIIAESECASHLKIFLNVIQNELVETAVYNLFKHDLRVSFYLLPAPLGNSNHNIIIFTVSILYFTFFVICIYFKLYWIRFIIYNILCMYIYITYYILTINSESLTFDKYKDKKKGKIS